MARHVSRRDFLKLSALAGAGMFVPWRLLHDAKPVQAFSNSNNLIKFIQPLRTIGNEISIATPDPASANPGWWQPGATHYTIDIAQFEDKLHPYLPNPTRLWGFGQGYDGKTAAWTTHLSGVIAAARNEPVQITFRNFLPPDHILPVDTSIMGADGVRNRTDVHLHGGFVPWLSDGGPHAWWDPNGHHGISFVNNRVLRPGQNVPANEAEYYYPNQQSARLMWYHDHTFGNTRINAYAGIATGYVIYDDYELSLARANAIPGPLDPRTVYLVFQDKIFVTPNILQPGPGNPDPDWTNEVPNTQVGDLWYNHHYDPADLPPGWTGPMPPEPSALPEFFGDTILANGTVYPWLEVQPQAYRFRILNACNARFLNPRLVMATGANGSEVDYASLNSTDAKAVVPFVQIGTEGGFLPAPVTLDGSSHSRLLMAPAERADLIIDFSNVPDGTNLILYNDAPAPYPMGDAITDYYPGNPDNPTPMVPGQGPNTRTLLQVRVRSAFHAQAALGSLPAKFTPTDPFLIPQVPGAPTDNPKGVKVRQLTLNETNDDFGRLIQYLGTPETDVIPDGSGALGLPYDMDDTEVIMAGTTEVWEILNLTGDTHPIHFHLSNVQVLSRQPFDPVAYQTAVQGQTTHTAPVPVPYTGSAFAPENNELGWKETVRMNPEEVTRVLIRFNLPVVPFAVPESPRTGGHEYVWHCHILEHEEHDMMRPLVVKSQYTYIPQIMK